MEPRIIQRGIKAVSYDAAIDGFAAMKGLKVETATFAGEEPENNAEREGAAGIPFLPFTLEGSDTGYCVSRNEEPGDPDHGTFYVWTPDFVSGR